MSVHIGDVRPGKCFLSLGAKPQVVRVLRVREGLVEFEARSRRRAWASRGATQLYEFVAGVCREVGPDFEPDSGPRVHV